MHPRLLTKGAAEDVLDSKLKEDVSVAKNWAMVIEDVSGTYEYADNLIPEGHHVLIFSQTHQMLDLIQDFQKGKASKFLLTSQVGCVGLTLTRADRVIVVGSAWNTSIDNQSVDWAYCIGQKKDAIVYRLVTCGTIEEKIYMRRVHKGGLFKAAIEHTEQISYSTDEERKELFSISKEGFDVSVTQQQLDKEHGRQYTMDDSLKAHIEFLESQDIAGVGYHNLLYSKTQAALEDDDHTDSKIKGIKDKINHLQNNLLNKKLMSTLSDKGEILRKTIAELEKEPAQLETKETS